MENNKAKGSTKNFNLIMDLSYLSSGALFLAMALFVGVNGIFAEIMPTFFGSGVALMIVGAASVTYDLQMWSLPLWIVESLLVIKNLSHKRSFRKNQTAIVPAILVACLGIAVTIIAWIPLGYVAYAVIDSFLLIFEFPSVALGTIHLMQWVIAWTPAVIIVGLLIYVIVHAFKTEYPSGPVGM